MRVLHVIARLNVGGTARYITQLANELPKHGIETFVATGFVQGAEVEDESAQSIDLIRVPAMGRSFNPIKDHFARKQLDRIIAEVKPDLIHTHTFKAGLLVRLQRNKLEELLGRKIKFIHTFHGHLFDDPEFKGFKAFAIKAIEKKLSKNSDQLITVGEIVKSDLDGKGIYGKNKTISIPPAVAPLKAAKPERSSMESEEMTANLASPRPRGVSRRAAGP